MNDSTDSGVYLYMGISIIVPSLGFLLVYLPILVIFFVDREFRKSLAYVIMTHIGVTDVLQLAIHLISGILVITQGDISFWMNKILGAILTALWFSMLLFTLFLTFNRFSTVLLPRYAYILQSYQFSAVLFLLCYLSFLLPFIFKLLPDCNYLFVSDSFYWGYLQTDGILSRIMSECGRYLVLTIVITSIFTYASIFIYIGWINKTKLTKRELKITIQVSIVVLYFFFSFIYWNYIMSWFTMQGVLWDYASMMVWVVMNGIHPVIYLIFNKRLRSSFIILLTEFRIPREGPNSTAVAAKTVMVKTISSTRKSPVVFIKPR